jgi:deoxycytidylate deaminase
MQTEIVKAMLEKCEKYKEKSTCNKRKVGSALVFPDGIAYFATNGSPIDPCTEKGKDYCTREGDGFIEMPEYETCPSACAEGSVIIHARTDGRKARDGTLISTDSPCERCTNLIIDSGIVSELYFGNYKNSEMRGRDFVYQIWMAREGISMNIIIGNRIYRYNNNDILDGLGRFEYGIRTPDRVYLHQMIDNGIKAHAERVKLLWTPNELVTVPLL